MVKKRPGLKGWMPIKTVPKDRPILICGPESSQFMADAVICAVRWTNSYGGCWMAEGTEEKIFYCRPKYWMELPEMPDGMKRL